MRMPRTLPIFALLGACSTVSSIGGGNTAHTGEVWFTRADTFFGLPLGSTVWYCPEPRELGPPTCEEAVINGPVPADTSPRRQDANASSTNDASPARTDAPARTTAATDAVRPATSAPTEPRCHDLQFGAGSPVGDTLTPDPMPAITRGTLRDGTYTLSRSQLHRPFGNTFPRRMAIRVRGETFEVISQRGEESPLVQGGTFRVDDGGGVRFSVTCPNEGALDFDHVSVTLDGFVLINLSARRTATFTRTAD